MFIIVVYFLGVGEAEGHVVEGEYFAVGERSAARHVNSLTFGRVAHAANLDGLSYLFITLFIIVVYWMCGGRITAGAFQIGDIVAIIEYAVLALFYLMAAQMVIAMLPRALECCRRVREVLDASVWSMNAPACAMESALSRSCSPAPASR